MQKYTTPYPDAKILGVDDEPYTLLGISANLRAVGYQHVKILEDSRLVMETLKRDNYSCILLDLTMPHLSGRELLPLIAREFPDVLVVILTGRTDLETVVSCMRDGAFDYITKPVETPRLFSIVEKAVQMRILQDENLCLKQGILGKKLKCSEAFEGIITDHSSLQSIFVYMEAISGSSYPALILGENGTGKELIARSLYKLSKCRGEFVAVNVAGLDDNLFSDTLFGHAKGAYTNADKERIGAIRKAENGVLFLDEIGDLEMASQVKLLRFLQEREFQSLGSDTTFQTNAKFIFSTNKDIEKAVHEGKFRQDLYYRLKTHTIHLPPLRDRLSDLPLLIKHFINKHAVLSAKRVAGYSPQLLNLMNHYRFPGNIRELESLIADAVANSDGKTLPLKPFVDVIKYKQPMQKNRVEAAPGPYSNAEAAPTLKDLEAAHISRVMDLTGNNIKVAANILGINYSALYRRLRKTKS